VDEQLKFQIRMRAKPDEQRTLVSRPQLSKHQLRHTLMGQMK